MSSPPAYDANPDRRPLPAGWITQYDPNYNAWFYVNTEVNPPVTTWNHPSGPVSVSTPPPEQKTYSPPANNNSSNYAGGYSPATGQGGYPSQGGGNGYPQPPFGGYGNSGNAEYERDYPQQNPNNQRGIGGLLGRLTGAGGRRPGDQIDSRFGNEGRFGGGGGGYMAGGGYPGRQQQPQVVYVEQQQAPRKGSGMGKIAMAAGGGLLGGVLLAEALDNDRGYDDDCGYDGGFDGGDFGGDDGGDFS